MNDQNITCPNCQNSILPSEKKCPHCGSKNHKGIIICKKCSKQFFEEAKQCPHCGSTAHKNFLKNHPLISFFLGLLLLAGLTGPNKSEDTSVVQHVPSKEQLINGIDFSYEPYKGKFKENKGISINPKLYNKSNWNIRVLGITCKSTISGVEYERTAKLFIPLGPKTPHEWENLSMDDLPIPKKKSDTYDCKISDAETF